MSATVDDLNLDALAALGDNPQGDIDTMFILLSGFMVFFMHCGFAMLSVGAVQAKNAKNIMLLILLDACFGCLAFFFVGFAFAYGGTYGDETKGNKFIGWGGFALQGLPRSDWYMWFFQYAFAATAATIVSGAVAERTRFVAYIAYVIFLSSWVYPVLAHWTWSAHGWASPALPPSERLFGVGLIDFAGCAPVHMIGGVSALAGAYIVGARYGRFEKDGTVNDIEGHNASLAILGVFILWFGWYGFNPGSALAILGNSEIAALAAVNTTLSAASGTLSAMVALGVKNFFFGEEGAAAWDLLGAANGTLGGLVAITAGCVVVQPWAAIVIGITGGIVYVVASWLISNVLQIDDPLDAGAVHCFCGGWGLIVVALFAHKPFVAQVYGEETAEAGHGIFIPGGNFSMLGSALIVIFATLVWTLGNMGPFFYVLNFLGLMRVTWEEEKIGLDCAFHGGAAYDHDEGADEETRDTLVDVCKQLEVLANRQFQLKQMINGKQGGLFGSGNKNPGSESPKVHENKLFDEDKGSPKSHNTKQFGEDEDK